MHSISLWTNVDKGVMIGPHERGHSLSGAGGSRAGPSLGEAYHPGASGLEPPSDHATTLPALGLAYAHWPAQDLCGAKLY